MYVVVWYGGGRYLHVDVGISSSIQGQCLVTIYVCLCTEPVGINTCVCVCACMEQCHLITM